MGVPLIPTVQQLSDQLINNLPQIKSTLVPVMETFANVVGLAMSVIAGLIAGLGVAYTKFEGFRNGVNSAFGAIKTMCQGMGEHNKFFGIY